MRLMKPYAKLGQLLKGNTPTLILRVLSEGPRHGYGIAREVERRSSGTLALGEGSLYPALRVLEADGLVTANWESETLGRRRKVYTLTDAGRIELERRCCSWRDFVRAMDSVLKGSSDAKQPA